MYILNFFIFLCLIHGLLAKKKSRLRRGAFITALFCIALQWELTPPRLSETLKDELVQVKSGKTFPVKPFFHTRFEKEDLVCAIPYGEPEQLGNNPVTKYFYQFYYSVPISDLYPVWLSLRRGSKTIEAINVGTERVRLVIKERKQQTGTPLAPASDRVDCVDAESGHVRAVDGRTTKYFYLSKQRD